MHPPADLKALSIDRGQSPAGLPARRRAPSVPWSWIFLLLVALAVWLFRGRLLAHIDQWTLPEVQTFRVSKTSPLAQASVSGTAANGYIVASKRAALSADTPGRIVELNVTEGSVVKKGDVVARLYSDEYAAQLRQTEAELLAAQRSVERVQAQAHAAQRSVEVSRAALASSQAALDQALAGDKLSQLELQRAQSLFDQTVMSQRELDLAQAESVRASAALHSAQAGVERARRDIDASQASAQAAQAAIAESQARLPVLEAARDTALATLDKTTVRAPFDGVVVLKDAEVGEVVSPNSLGGNSRGSVATMVDFDSLEVQVELSETSLEAARVGGTAKIFLDAYPQKLYEGRVQRIWPTANRQKATVEVRVSFVRPDEMLRPEMGARVVFGGESAEAQSPPGQPAPELILIPRECVVKLEGQVGVFELERETASFRPVDVGEERAGKVLVESGLEGGETLILSAPASLKSGARVRVKRS